MRNKGKEKKGQAKRRRSIKITLTRESGVQDEFYVNHKTDSAVVADVKRLANAWADYIYRGYTVTDKDRRDTENLPHDIRIQFIKKGLIPGKPDEVIPTLAEWIDNLHANGVLKDVCHQKVKVILEHHGNKRIDLITESEAKECRIYLLVRRARPLSEASTSKAIQIARRVFNHAVDAEFIKKNPYKKVVAGSMSNPDSYYYISGEEWQKTVDLIPADTPQGREWRLVMALARWEGLRIPSEIRNLQFSSFYFKENGNGKFDVPVSGKTGMRGVPVFARFVPYYQDIRAAAPAEQKYLFDVYRNASNSTLSVLIKKIMQRAGLVPWKKFMHNQRRSFIKDLVDAGWSEFQITSVCGNTKEVRELFYYFSMSKDELADKGGAGTGFGSSVGNAPLSAPLFTPFLPPESDDPAELEKWMNTVFEKMLCKPLGLDMSGEELRNGMESHEEYRMGCDELTSMISTLCDFAEGKMTESEAMKRIDDSSYRTLFLRDELLKKAVRKMQESEGEKRGANAPRLGDTGLEPVTPSLSS